MEKKESAAAACKIVSLSPERSRLMNLLKTEYSEGELQEEGRRLVMLVPARDYERLGNLIGHLQNFIESRLPYRREHLYIVIRDLEGGRENVFKLWSSIS